MGLDPSEGWRCRSACPGRETRMRMMKKRRRKGWSKWMWTTEEFVGCWWRCGVKVPKAGAGAGAAGAAGGEGG